MMTSLKGKRLLILGATAMEIDIIHAAQEMGIYTIVTDNHTDWSMAPAKYVADEAWKLSKALGTPFYADGAQLGVICDKVKFKEACIASGIKTPVSYRYGDSIEFPVIVKPADNGGSRGITVCHIPEEFEAAYRKAMEASTSKEVLIEQYIVADEIMVYFTVHDDEIEVSAMCDRYMHHFGTQITQLPIGYFYPSKHLETFTKWNQEKYYNLIHRLGIHNGLIAFQAFVVEQDVIPFDPTYRLDGTMTYHIVEAINGCNVLKMMIQHSMAGSMGDKKVIAKSENPRFDKYAFQLPVLLRKGTICKITGMDRIARLSSVVHIQCNHAVGEVFEKEADFSQIFCRIHLVEDSVEHIREDIAAIYNSLKITDENGEDMIICRMDINKIG